MSEKERLKVWMSDWSEEIISIVSLHVGNKKGIPKSDAQQIKALHLRIVAARKLAELL